MPSSMKTEIPPGWRLRKRVTSYTFESMMIHYGTREHCRSARAFRSDAPGYPPYCAVQCVKRKPRLRGRAEWKSTPRTWATSSRVNFFSSLVAIVTQYAG